MKLKGDAKIYTYEQRKVTNCENYKVFSQGKCDSRQNCIETCYIEKFRDKHFKLPSVDSLVYPDDYPEGHQKSLFFLHEEKKEEQLLINCTEKYEKPDCESIRFNPHFESNKHNSAKELVIDPFFFRIKEGNRLNFNFFQMICSFITLSTILTGLNWPRASNTVIRLVNYFLKEEDRLDLKNLFFLISFLGFFWHAYHIFNETCFTEPEINSRIDFDFLNSNEYIPDLVLCLKHNLNISKGFKSNEEPTGALLEGKTKWLNESYLFDEIIYFDSNMIKQSWSPQHKRSDDNLRIHKWFMHEFKCFTLAYRMNHQSVKNYVINTILKLNFNPELASSNETFLFSAKHAHTNDFSNYYRLDFKAVSRVQYTYYHTYYYDQYQSLANPRLWLYRGHKINVSDFN